MVPGSIYTAKIIPAQITSKHLNLIPNHLSYNMFKVISQRKVYFNDLQ